MKHTDFMGIAAENWRGLDDKTRAKYEAKAQEDKNRYDKQLAEWNDKGYFTRPDGTKSNDILKDGSKSSVATESEEEKIPPKKSKKPAKK